MVLGARDVELLAAVAIAFRAFDPAAGLAGLTGAADISHLSQEELERGERLFETADEETLRAALASVEADLASAARTVRKGRVS